MSQMSFVSTECLRIPAESCDKGSTVESGPCAFLLCSLFSKQAPKEIQCRLKCSLELGRNPVPVCTYVVDENEGSVQKAQLLPRLSLSLEF